MDPWASAADLKARAGMETLSDPQAAAAVAAASDLLDRLTMRQFGVHSDVVRPEGCGGWDPGAPSGRAVVGWGLSQPLARAVGPWPLPGPFGGMVDWCGTCHGLWTTGVRLLAPVVDMSEVLVDGQPFPDFQVWDGQWLLRTDGKVWPQCQNLRAEPSEADTFQVSYTHGQPVSALGVESALSLAAELARWWGYAGGDCRLPKRVTQITRQGVTAVVLDPMDILKSGGTGLPDVDLFVASSIRVSRRATITTPGVDSGLARRTL